MKLYVDVTNTLLAVSVTGIQRVTCELLARLIEGADDFEICLLQERDAFALGGEIHYAALEPRQMLAAMRRPAGERTLIPQRFLALRELESGSVFFDLDAVWHNQVRRSLLYPSLRSQGLAILAMHYDAVPVHHSELAHPQTVEKFVPTLEAQLRHADRLLAISQAVRDDLMTVAGERGWPRCDLQVVRLGSDFEILDEGDSSADGQEIDLPSKIQAGGFVLCVGTLEPRKNQAVLLDAFDKLSEELKDLTLVLVGRAGWLVEDLLERLAKHPLRDDRLFWLERVPDVALATLYRQASLVVYPSLYEGYGLPVVEALAAGTVTLSSDRGALPEVASGFADFFDPTSGDELAALLRRYLADENAFRRRRDELAAFEPPRWESTATEVATAVRELGSRPHIRCRRQRFQIVVLSIHPDLLRNTLAYVEHLMPFVDEVLVVTPHRLAEQFQGVTSLPLVVLTDEEILGDDLEQFQASDHQGKNWLLRCALMRSDRVRDRFIMCDDDYRPLRPIPVRFFEDRGRVCAYYFHDLSDWPSRAALPTPYDLGVRNAAALLARHGYRGAKAFSCHCPQLIDKEIFIEMLDSFGEEMRTLAVDEWSTYFNYGLRHYPDRFEARPFRTLCWPASPTDWEGRYAPSEFYFENYYPDLYRSGQIFSGLPQELTADYHVHSLEKVTRRLRQQADYDRSRQLRDASLARATEAELAASHSLSAGNLGLTLSRLPERLESRADAVLKLPVEIEVTSPMPDAERSREVSLHHRIFDAQEALISAAAYPVDLSRIVQRRAAEVVECPILAPARPGSYRVEFRLRGEGLESSMSAGPSLELVVLS